VLPRYWLLIGHHIQVVMMARISVHHENFVRLQPRTLFLFGGCILVWALRRLIAIVNRLSRALDDVHVSALDFIWVVQEGGRLTWSSVSTHVFEDIVELQTCCIVEISFIVRTQVIWWLSLLHVLIRVLVIRFVSGFRARFVRPASIRIFTPRRVFVFMRFVCSISWRRSLPALTMRALPRFIDFIFLEFLLIVFQFIIVRLSRSAIFRTKLI
jgi:magnesium-transporting ATPase (P-type)